MVRGPEDQAEFLEGSGTQIVASRSAKEEGPWQTLSFQLVSWNGYTLGLRVIIKQSSPWKSPALNSSVLNWVQVICLHFAPKRNKSFLKEDVIHQNLKLPSYFFIHNINTQ